MDMPATANLPESPSEKFLGVHMRISKQQALAWFLFTFGLIVQGVCTGFLVAFTLQISKDLRNTEQSPDVDKCPVPSKVVPIYIFIGLQVILGIIFYFLSAWAFSKAHVFIK